MVKMGLTYGNGDNDGRAIQADAHAGAYGAALRHRLVEPVLGGAIDGIGIGVGTRDILNQLCEPLSQELAGSIADGCFVDIVAVAGHEKKGISSGYWSEQSHRCRR